MIGILLILGTLANYAPGRLIIKFKESIRPNLVSHIHSLERSWGEKIKPLIVDPNMPPEAKSYGLDLFYLITFPESIPVEEVKKAYASLPEVDYVEPDLLFKPCREPNDSLFLEQTHLSQIDVPSAWDITTGDTSTIVAVIDGGCDWDHPDIEPDLWINEEEDINHNGRFDTTDVSLGGDINGIDDDGNGYIDDVIGWNFMKNTNNPSNLGGLESHGTSCWGIATAATDNSIGIASIGWGCRGIAFCCATLDGYISGAYATQAMYYAERKGACAISMSWGAYQPLGSLINVIRYYRDREIALCAGAGNDHKDTPFYPAAYNEVIGVAGTDTESKPANFTNYGDWIDVCSPAVNVWATKVGGGYGTTSATSFCTPTVAGLIGLIKSVKPNLTAEEVEEVIFSTCDPIDDTLYEKGLLGNGQINAGQALNRALGVSERKERISERVEISPNPSGGKIKITIHHPSPVEVSIYNIAGELIKRKEGASTIIWDGRDGTGIPIPDGVYFIMAKGKEYTETKKVLILH